jgi:hypothetical protein
MCVCVFGGFFQFTIRRLQMFECLFGVATKLFVIVDAGRFRFLPSRADVMLRGCQMWMPMSVDVLCRPLCDGDAGQNQQYGQDAAPQEIRFHCDFLSCEEHSMKAARSLRRCDSYRRRNVSSTIALRVHELQPDARLLFPHRGQAPIERECVVEARLAQRFDFSFAEAHATRVFVFALQRCVKHCWIVR